MDPRLEQGAAVTIGRLVDRVWTLGAVPGHDAAQQKACPEAEHSPGNTLNRVHGVVNGAVCRGPVGREGQGCGAHQGRSPGGTRVLWCLLERGLVGGGVGGRQLVCSQGRAHGCGEGGVRERRAHQKWQEEASDEEDDKGEKYSFNRGSGAGSGAGGGAVCEAQGCEAEGDGGEHTPKRRAIRHTVLCLSGESRHKGRYSRFHFPMQ